MKQSIFANFSSSLFSRPFKIGVSHASDEAEKKRIYFVNAVCILSCFTILVLVILGYFFDPNLISKLSLLGYALYSVNLGVIFTCQAKGCKIVAKSLVVLNSFVIVYLFDTFLIPTNPTEFYYILPTLYALFLFKNKWISHVLLFVSITLFFEFFGTLNDKEFDERSIHFVVFFMIIYTCFFIIIQINENSEKQLSLEKLKAEKDKTVIENQKMRLGELDDFKNKFFINISHELRTPLTLIGGLTSQLKKTDVSDKILEQSGKMKQIVDDILDLSKLKAQKLSLTKRLTDVNTVLKRLYDSFLPSFEEKNLHFNLYLSSEQCYSEVDLIYFERSINNILLNSLKFTEEGEVSITLKKEKSQLIISIEDTGIGIDSLQLENVFNEFYQIDNDINKASGSGIGLSFSKDIIELHGGGIKLDSDLGKGTVVNIYLKTTLNKIETRAETNSVNDIASISISPSQTQDLIFQEGKTILVVEDHLEMRSYIGSLLNGYKVVFAENGEEGLNQLKEEAVDFIITDYMMPKLDGYEFIKKLKDLKYEMPILMLTARADIEAKLNILRLGIDDYMTKPFNTDELLVRIENALSNNKERKDYREVEKIDEVEEEVQSIFIQRLKAYTLEHCSNNLFTLEDIKEEFALSSSSLYRKVKLETGMSPNQFVREIRLQKARALLEVNRNMSLKTLSISIGIKNASYFAKHYKARFGTELSAILIKE